jgi:hypothetical protein
MIVARKNWYGVHIMNWTEKSESRSNLKWKKSERVRFKLYFGISNVFIFLMMLNYRIDKSCFNLLQVLTSNHRE